MGCDCPVLGDYWKDSRRKQLSTKHLFKEKYSLYSAFPGIRFFLWWALLRNTVKGYILEAGWQLLVEYVFSGEDHVPLVRRHLHVISLSLSSVHHLAPLSIQLTWSLEAAHIRLNWTFHPVANLTSPWDEIRIKKPGQVWISNGWLHWVLMIMETYVAGWNFRHTCVHFS